mgnify:CR=1 FL=1
MKKTILILMSVLCLGAPLSLLVKASEAVQEVEISELNQIMTANDKLEIKETPDDNASVIFTYESGAGVFVTGETTDGWYRVSYQDKVGYVRKAELEATELDVEGIDREMADAAAEGKQIVEEVERYRIEAQRTKIWGTIIILLVVGIFATGIISTIKNEKEEDEGNGTVKVPYRKLKIEKAQVEEAENQVEAVEAANLFVLNNEEKDSFNSFDKEKWDAFEDLDREEWDLLCDSDKEEWDALIYSDKKERYLLLFIKKT